MSGGISATTIAVGAAAGLAAQTLLAPKPQMPAAPPAPTAPPTPASQAAKSADPNALKKKNVASEAGGAGGVNNTLLTGPGGITPDLLNLGKATLLGQ